jgi:class 3 adenylate cyclase
MKRLLISAGIIAVAVAAIGTISHASGWFHGIEFPLKSWLENLNGPAPHDLGKAWQYSLIFLLGLGTAWISLTSARRHSVAILVLAVIVELLALTWVCSLYHVFFTPFPAIVAVALSYGAALGYLAFAVRKRAGIPLSLFNGKLSRNEIARLRSGETEFDGCARTFETTVVVCDLANKYDLADNDDPSVVTKASEKFTARAAELLRDAGAYLHAADGEGVVAVFGFPAALEHHAEKAVRAAFDLANSFAENSSGGNGQTVTAGAHVGVSSGSMITAPTEEKQDIFVLGEPIELARRFCVANRFYGSKILIGPRTFELANNAIVARPIDFLSGVNAQERHEIYEPLAFTADAPSELVARRDSFWNGVVLYREQRWAEAYHEFQKARGPNNEEDAPLNLYLRRLEPLALRLMESSGS